MRKLGALFLLLTVAACSQAPISVPSAPVRLQPEPLAASVQLSPPGRLARIPPSSRLALGPLTEEERNRPSRRPGLPVVGVVRQLRTDGAAEGRCERLPDGVMVWRLELESAGAAGIRVRFEDFDVGDGRVWLYADDETLGPYSGRGIFGDGEFWTGAIFADRIVIEYEPSRGSACSDEPPFRIREITHLWETPLSPATGKSPRSYAAASCHLDVSCYPEYATQASGVGHYTYISEGRSYVCSGALLNTRPYSGIPYFLTAYHCVASDTEARTVNVYWFYQTPYCNGPPPDRRALPYRTEGASFLIGKDIPEGDFSLLRLTSLPSAPDLRFQGWTTVEPAQGASAVGIHHPKGDYKRISFGFRTSDASSNVEGKNAPANYYYQIQWTAGRTEGGSSGSPLFVRSGDASTWLIAGVLSYVPKTDDVCSYNPFVAGYGRLSTAYPYLRAYLNLESCTYTFSPPSLSVGYAGGSFYTDLTVTGGCAWSASSDQSWLRIGTGSGTGSARIYFTVDPNYSYSSRVGRIRVADQIFTVTQGGMPACPATAISVGQTVSGSLSSGTCTSWYRGSAYYAARYTFSGTAGQAVYILLTSSAFDTYLYLIDPAGRVVAEDDDGGGGLNSRIPAGSGSLVLPSTGTYSIEVTSYAPYATGEYRLSLVSGSGVPNDEPGAAMVIGSLPYVQSMDTVAATGNVGDPVHSCTGMRDSNTVWFRWVADFTGRLRVTTFGSTYDTVLAAYTGSSVPGTELACNDDSDGTLQSRIEFSVARGQSYLIQVSDYGSPGGGTLVLNVRGVAPGDFSGDGRQDLIWQNDTWRQVTVHYYRGANFAGWAWVNASGASGWRVVGTADFDGNGTPDLVWQNDSTRQLTVHYYDGTSFTGWNWLNSNSNPGWRVVAVADFNRDGKPDLIWQSDATRQVVVHYYGGGGGATFLGWAWLNASGVPGWRVAGAGDFDGNGTPDLVWQNESSRQVTVHYYAGTTWTGWNWLNSTGFTGWSLAGVGDFDGDGRPELVWQNDTTRQVTVHYYGGSSGNQFLGWAWLNASGVPGWRPIVPR